MNGRQQSASLKRAVGAQQHQAVSTATFCSDRITHSPEAVRVQRQL